MRANRSAILRSGHRNQLSTCFALKLFLCILFFTGQMKESTARTLMQPAGGAYAAQESVSQDGPEAR
jgi:hypothetical protein